MGNSGQLTEYLSLILTVIHIKYDGSRRLRAFEFWSGYRPITLTRIFELRHNKLSNVRTNIPKYVVTWLEHSGENNKPVPGPLLAEHRIFSSSHLFLPSEFISLPFQLVGSFADKIFLGEMGGAQFGTYRLADREFARSGWAQDDDARH